MAQCDLGMSVNKGYGPADVSHHFSLRLLDSQAHGNSSDKVGPVALGKALFWSVSADDRPGPMCSGSMCSNSQASGVCEPT